MNIQKENCRFLNIHFSPIVNVLFKKSVKMRASEAQGESTFRIIFTFIVYTIKLKYYEQEIQPDNCRLP
jgi:hypothetical protein